MKRIFKVIAVVAAVLIIGIWQLNKAPFNQAHDDNVSANIYKDGVKTGDTRISIYGQKAIISFMKTTVLKENL